MNEREELEMAIEILQLKKAMVMKQAQKGEFQKVEAEIRKLNEEEKKVYEGEEETIHKVLTEYKEEVKKS